MPWRAGQVYGHLRRTALLHASTPRIVVCRSFLVIQPFHQSIPSRWPAAAAALSVQTPSVGQVRGIEDVGKLGGGIALEDGAAHVPRGDADTTDTRPRVIRNPIPKVDLPEAAIDGMFLRLSQTGSVPDAAENSKWAQLREHLREPGQVVILAVKLSRTRQPHRVLRVLALAHMLGCKLQQHGYESIAYHLASADHWSLVTSLVELARRHSGRTTLRLLNWRARALVKLQDFAALDRVLDIYEQEQVRPDRRTFHIIIAGHLRNRDLARAKRCLAFMVEAGIEADASTHSLIIASYRQFGLAKSVQSRALDVLYQTDDCSATNIVNSLIQQCLDKDDIQGAMRYFALFDASSTPSTGGDSIHLDGELRSKEFVDVHSDKTPSQDAHTFTILINHFSKQGDLRRVLHILGRMRESGIEPDSSVAAALVHAYFSAGEAVEAVHAVASLCRPRRVPYAFFRWLGLTAGRRNGPSLLPAGLPLTTEIFNALVRGSLATHGINGMANVLRIMNWCNIEPDETTAHILLLYLDKVEGASPRDIMRHFRRLLPLQVIPTIQHLNVILTSILRREAQQRRQMDRKPPVESSTPSDGAEVESLAWDWISGTTKNSYDPAAGLEIPRWLSYRTQVQPILDSLSDREVRSDRATYALRIRHDAVIKRDLEMAKETFQAMINRGLHPNKYHFAAVMEGYAARGDVEGAMAVMDSALKEGIRPNVEMYTILITACTRSKRPRRAFRIFQAMLAKGVQPDVLCVLALTWSFFVARQTGKARRILLQLWPTVVGIQDGLDTTVPLKNLMQAFALHAKNTNRKILSRQQARMLRWKVNEIMRRWTKTWPRRDTLHSSTTSAPAVSSQPTNGS